MIGAAARRRPAQRDGRPRGARSTSSCGDRWTSSEPSGRPSVVDRGVDADTAPPVPERRSPQRERRRTDQRCGSARRGPRRGRTTGQCLNAHRRDGMASALGQRRRLAPLDLLQGDDVGRERGDDGSDGRRRRRPAEPCTFQVSTRTAPSLHAATVADRCAPVAYRRPAWPLPRCRRSCTRSPSRPEPSFTVIARGEGALVWDADGQRVRRRHGQPVVLRRRPRARRDRRRRRRPAAHDRRLLVLRPVHATGRPTSWPSGWSGSRRSPTPACSSAGPARRPSTRR